MSDEEPGPLDRFRSELEARARSLQEELERARETVRALIAGEIDSVATGDGASPTLLRRAQDRLRQRERQLRAVFEGAMDGMLVLSDDGSCLDANAAAVDLFGTTRAELTAMGTRELGAMGLAPNGWWEELLDSGHAAGELELTRPNGERRAVELRAAAEIAPGRHLIVLRDVTERRRLEAELLRSQRLESVGQLAAGVAHDFNNLLASIIGFGGFLTESLPPGDPRRADVMEILRAAERASELVRQLLAFGRKQVLIPRPVALSRLVGDAVHMTRRLIPEEVELEVDVRDAGTNVRVDPDEIQRVLVGMILNARDATGGSGRITVSACRLDGDGPTAPLPDLVEADAHALIAVADDGVGMDETVRQRVFEPFFTTKAVGKGDGLGLATAYGVIKQSGGDVTVESEPGVGSRFCIFLPLATAAGDPSGPE